MVWRITGAESYVSETEQVNESLEVASLKG
jgi:hypothetical protein